jgi:hypothetical protein
MVFITKERDQHFKKTQKLSSRFFSIIVLAFFVFSLLQLSCVLSSLIPSDVDSTTTILSLNQTSIANTVTQRIITASTLTPSTPLTTTISPTAPISSETISPVTSTTPTPDLSETDDLISRMKSANILLYEDMVENRDARRYIRDTLDRMELPYTDIGSADGWLKTSIIGGVPGGGEWDLIIIASEAKMGISGEFFQYINNALDKDISVILEIGYLDQIANGVANEVLERCGVAFQSDWRNIHPSRMVMFPLGTTHPILNEPNSGLSFTKVTEYWWDPSGENVYDIGDRMQLTFNGDAILLLGTSAIDKNKNGTLTNCINNRLTLQTFSSHQIAYETMQLLWENYIYNALKIRILGSY